MIGINGRRATNAAKGSLPEHPGPVSLNMVIGQKSGSRQQQHQQQQQQQQQHQHQTHQTSARESNDDTLSQLEQHVRSIEVNTMAAARLRDEIVHEPAPDVYLRYREHEDLLGTINHEPER